MFHHALCLLKIYIQITYVICLNDVIHYDAYVLEWYYTTILHRTLNKYLNVR